MLNDFTLYAYIATTLVALYGFLLFVTWWIKIKNVSDVYSYVTFLFGALVLVYAPQIYSRYIFLTGGSDGEYDFFMHSCTWKWRTVPVLIILLVIVVRMTCRIMGITKSNGKYYISKRKNDL